MDFTECKKYLEDEGVEVSNLSEDTLKFLCEEAFEGVGPGPAPDIKSVDPAERVKAGIQSLDDYISSNKKGAILDLISDAIEMTAKRTKDAN